MQLQIILVGLAVCSSLLCLTNAASSGGIEMGEGSTKRRFDIHFTQQEHDFILDEVANQAKTRQVTSWTLMAKKHERKVANKEKGFKRKRTSDGLRKHFDRYLKHEMPTWKPKSSTHEFKRYTEQEEAFINKELLDESFRSKHLYSLDVWNAILDKHNIKRQQNCEGFSHERSLVGLCSHFRLSMKPGQRVSKEVIARFPKNFPPYQESTSTNNIQEENYPDHDTEPCAVGTSGQKSSSNDDEVFGTIMKELEEMQNSVDEDGIDHSLFVENNSSSEYPVD